MPILIGLRRSLVVCRLCLTICAFTLFLAACSTAHSPAATLSALYQDRFIRLQPHSLVAAFVSSTGGADQLTFLIESDGARWPSIDTPPKDPTPSSSVMIAIARLEAKHGRVIYLGRPCQYLTRLESAGCSINLWTQARFGEQAIDAIDQSISILVQKYGANKINLVGHSGGGVAALLVAARRSDVQCVVTFASPLYLRRWTTLMGVSELTESTDPSDHFAALERIRQTHFAGSADSTVPPEVFAGGNAKTSFPVAVLPGFNHYSPWAARWSFIRSQSCL